MSEPPIVRRTVPRRRPLELSTMTSVPTGNRSPGVFRRVAPVVEPFRGGGAVALREAGGVLRPEGAAGGAWADQIVGWDPASVPGLPSEVRVRSCGRRGRGPEMGGRSARSSATKATSGGPPRAPVSISAAPGET